MMRKAIILSFLVLACLAFGPFALAQNQGNFGRAETETQSEKELTPGPGWKTCPRCTNSKQLAAANKAYKVEGHPFDPHDLSGVWGNNGMELDVKNVPSFTPEGAKMFEATHSDIPTTNSKDGMLICDPLGYPRLFAYNYGMQFVMLPDRVLQDFKPTALHGNPIEQNGGEHDPPDRKQTIRRAIEDGREQHVPRHSVHKSRKKDHGPQTRE